jgi:hypothetical protein
LSKFRKIFANHGNSTANRFFWGIVLVAGEKKRQFTKVEHGDPADFYTLHPIAKSKNRIVEENAIQLFNLGRIYQECAVASE